MVSVKTAIIGGVAALALGTLVLGTSWVSYVRTAKNEVSSAVEDSFTMEFQLKRAKDMLDNELKPEIRKMTHLVAESQIKVEHLEKELLGQQEVLTNERAELMARHEQLKSPKTTFTISNVSYTKKELETDQMGRLADVKKLEGKLATGQNLLKARRDALRANESKVEKLLTAREELNNQIEQLKSRVSALKATETIHESDFDDSKLSNVKDLLDSLKAKVEVRERENSIEGKRTERIPVETEESSKSVVDSVDAYFGTQDRFEDTASN